MVEYSADRPIPTQNEAPVIGAAGIFTASWYSWFKRIDQFARATINDLPAEQQALADRVTALEGASITDTREWSMVFVEDGTYHLALNTPYQMEFTAVTTRSESGNCTATVKINGVALGGTANSVSSSEQTQPHTSSNVASSGDDVTVVISSNSGCEGMRLSAVFNRPLFV